MECSSYRSCSNDGITSSTPLLPTITTLSYCNHKQPQQSQQCQYSNKLEETKPLIMISNGMTKELNESYRNLRIHSMLLFATSFFFMTLR